VAQRQQKANPTSTARAATGSADDRTVCEKILPMEHTLLRGALELKNDAGRFEGPNAAVQSRIQAFFA
jgi:hypothetical protein